MKSNFLIFFFCLDITFCYYSLKLKEVYLSLLSNDSDIVYNLSEKNESFREHIEEMEEYIDLPLNASELNIINDSFIKTKNINSSSYAIDFFLGSNRQNVRLLLSTFDEFTTVSSINCKSCNVYNKYNYSLSNTSMQINNLDNGNPLYYYQFFQDSCSISAESMQNGVKEKKSITMQKLILKVIESDNSGFLNSDSIDGILSLSYSNGQTLPSNNFVQELFNEGLISSPSFSIIITSSKINRLYLGDIMKNEYIKNYVDSSMNKGECKIIANLWNCRVNKIEYTDFKYVSPPTKRAYSTVSFDLKRDKLIIPYFYYYYLVVGWRYEKNKREFNKLCANFSGSIYCNCFDKNSFGILTLHFENNSKLDVDLRDYVHYNSSAFYFRCRVDVVLSKNDEFIVGLRGLNNTILSFDLDDKKIEFFHKKKDQINYFWPIFIFIIFVVLFIFLDSIK